MNLLKRFKFRKFRELANRSFRVLQIDENSYEIQVYQDVGLNGNVDLKWTPLIFDTLDEKSTVADYMKVCDALRNTLYDKLVSEYDESQKKKEYPKVIY